MNTLIITLNKSSKLHHDRFTKITPLSYRTKFVLNPQKIKAKVNNDSGLNMCRPTRCLKEFTITTTISYRYAIQ